MIPKHEKEYKEYKWIQEGGVITIPTYEDDLRSLIEDHRLEERYHKAKRRELEGRLNALLDRREAKRLRARAYGCPPAFAYDCILVDGTRCPYYHVTGDEGVCVKAEEVKA